MGHNRISPTKHGSRLRMTKCNMYGCLEPWLHISQSLLVRRLVAQKPLTAMASYSLTSTAAHTAGVRLIEIIGARIAHAISFKVATAPDISRLMTSRILCSKLLATTGCRQAVMALLKLTSAGGHVVFAPFSVKSHGKTGDIQFES